MMNSFSRVALMVSLGTNLVLFVCLLILDARISKLENKHYDSSPLRVTFGAGKKE